MYYRQVKAQTFKKSLKGSKHGQMLSEYSSKELDKMKLFKEQGSKIGYALKLKDGIHQEIVLVHNNSGLKGIGPGLITHAINQGGKYLDHFDGFLTGFYESLGFKEYKRDKFDPQYVDDDFINKYGKADVIYRKLEE